MNKVPFYKVFCCGIENQEYLLKRVEGISYVKNVLKIIRLVLFRVFCCRRTHLSSTSLLLVWEPLHEKILDHYDGEKIVLIGRINNMSGNSFLSYIPIPHICKSVFTVPYNVVKKRLLYDWLFFRLLANFLTSNDIYNITIAGHYDKYATWIAYLAKRMKINLTISQHGLNTKYKLPYKIPSNRVEVFSKAEEEMFRSTVLQPDMTEFLIKGFHSTLIFSEGKFSKRTIAVASQPGYEGLVCQVVDLLKSIDEQLNVIVYSHPSDCFRKGKMKLDSDIVLINSERYSDIDYLLVFTSTLAYDYWSCTSFKGQVLCYYDQNIIVAFYDDERAVVLYPETLERQLNEILYKG